MTSDVISVDENASVAAVAKLLAGRGISGVPVVDSANRVIGMVSEGDLLHRAETGTERRRSWWLEMMASTDKLAGEYVKAHGRTVKDVMTRNVISVAEATPIADIALLLETNGIKRVPVVRDGKRRYRQSGKPRQALATTIDDPASSADTRDPQLLAELRYRGGLRSRRPTSSSRIGSFIFGVHISRNKRSKHCASPPRTSREFGASRTT
jgi:CBS domain-containing protein